MKLTLALLLITSPAAGETFAERWPSPVTVDPAPVSARDAAPSRFDLARRVRQLASGYPAEVLCTSQ